MTRLKKGQSVRFFDYGIDRYATFKNYKGDGTWVRVEYCGEVKVLEAAKVRVSPIALWDTNQISMENFEYEALEEPLEHDWVEEVLADDVTTWIEIYRNQEKDPPTSKRFIEWLKSIDALDVYREEALNTWSPDDDHLGFRWEAFEEELNNIVCDMESKADSNMYLIEGRNIGWRNREGYKVVKLETGRDLLDAVTPKSEYTLEVFEEKKGISIRLYHHDSPTGESYTVEPLRPYIRRSCQMKQLKSFLMDKDEDVKALVKWDELLDYLFDNELAEEFLVEIR